MKITFNVDNMNTIYWYMDASYGTHWYFKGHTGMVMMWGKGALMSFSLKQEINSQSSTEAKLIGIDNAITCMIWDQDFIEAQLYTVSHNVLYQYNKSTILVADNGRIHSTKTKHIKHRYFLVNDKIIQGNLEIKYKSTDQMWSNVLAKPHQGKAYCIFCSHIMNVPEDYDNDMERSKTRPLLLPKYDKAVGITALVHKGQSVLQNVTWGRHKILPNNSVK